MNTLLEKLLSELEAAKMEYSRHYDGEHIAYNEALDEAKAIATKVLAVGEGHVEHVRNAIMSRDISGSGGEILDRYTELAKAALTAAGLGENNA